MTENTNDTVTVDKTTSSRGAQWAGAGSLIALAAQSLLGNGNGGGILGNILGGGNGNGGCGGMGGNGAANAAVTALMVENAKLKADAETNDKLTEVYALLRSQDKDQDKFTFAIDKRLSALETAAPLREEILKGKINEVAMLANNGITALQGQVTCLANTVNGIVTPVIKNSAICPGWGNVTITPATTTTTTTT